MIKRFGINTAGRDLIVGDIHGHFARLERAMAVIEFNPAVDRLFSVGDLVDRGPDSELVLDWLAKPWFHAVCGNHEEMTADAYAGLIHEDMHVVNGGRWFYQLPPEDRKLFAQILRELPVLIEIETPKGLVGLVHAGCPTDDWAHLRRQILRDVNSAGHVPVFGTNEWRNLALWDRRRADGVINGEVRGVRAVVSGHTPMTRPVVADNHHFIDTAGWLSLPTSAFTFLDAATLQSTVVPNNQPGQAPEAERL